MTAAPLLDRFAAIVGRAWFEVCEQPGQSKPGAWSPDQLATFRAMAEAALHAARHGDRSELGIARALAFGFWRDDPRPWEFDRLGRMRQEAFLSVARRVIEAGRALRSEAQAGEVTRDLPPERAERAA